jgi:WD40 repeat protein
VYGVAFSRDGTTLASAGADATVRLWSVASHRQLGAPLSGHTDAVLGVAFSPDGKTLASAGFDGTVRLWSVAGRRQLGAPLRGHPDVIDGVAFSPNGTTLASAGGDQTVRLWDSILWSDSWRVLQRFVCPAVQRGLTRAEWNEFVPGQPYLHTCTPG